MTFRTTLGAMTLAAAIWPRAARFPTLSSAWAAFSTVRRAALSSMRARAKSALQQNGNRFRRRGELQAKARASEVHYSQHAPAEPTLQQRAGMFQVWNSAAGSVQVQVQQSLPGRVCHAAHPGFDASGGHHAEPLSLM